MKNEKLLEAIGNIDDEMIYKAVNDVKPRRRANWYKWALVAAAFVLVFTGAVMTTKVAGANRVAAIVALDVNPSIEIEVNRDEKVLKVSALNDDAKVVIGDMDFERVDLEVALNAIIGSMFNKGYLSLDKNSLMISVASDDVERRDALQTRLTSKVEKMYEENDIHPSILTQTYDKDENFVQEMDNTSISPAKMALVEKILAAGLVDFHGNAYTKENLSELSVNELKVILESRNVSVDGIVNTGDASQEAYIGKTKAIEIACSHAGVEPSDVSNLVCQMDYENHSMVYEMEFYVHSTEYEYEIDAKTGNIVNVDLDREDAVNNVQPNDIPLAPTYISKDSALSLAYTHAGVDGASVFGLECELDDDDGVAVYEVSFHSGSYEYDYEINAITGAILESEKDIDD